MSDDILIWVDTETLGLIPQLHPVIEVGIRITNLELDTLGEISTTIWEQPYFAIFEQANEFVRTTHRASGLYQQAIVEKVGRADAEDRLMGWLAENVGDVKHPLCGSSVHFDRAMLDHWLPGLLDKFTYRNIDVSTIKELCQRYEPQMYADMEGKTLNRKLHRALPDLDDTISEFFYYLDNFLDVTL